MMQWTDGLPWSSIIRLPLPSLTASRQMLLPYQMKFAPVRMALATARIQPITAMYRVAGNAYLFFCGNDFGSGQAKHGELHAYRQSQEMRDEMILGILHCTVNFLSSVFGRR